MTTATSTRKPKPASDDAPPPDDLPTAAHAPEPDPAGAWLAEAAAVFDDLQGGAVHRLEALAARAPTGPDCFAPLLALLRRFGVVHHPDPVRAEAEAEARVGPLGEYGGRAAAEAVRRLVAAHATLDAGHDCPSDPMARASDFGGQVVTLVLPGFVGPFAAGDPAGKPAAHPFRGVEPYLTTDRRRVVILGPHAPGRAVMYRLSDAARLTGREVARQRTEAAEQERVDALEREQAEAAFRRAPDGQWARLAELEATVARLQGDGGGS